MFPALGTPHLTLSDDVIIVAGSGKSILRFVHLQLILLGVTDIVSVPQLSKISRSYARPDKRR